MQKDLVNDGRACGRLLENVSAGRSPPHLLIVADGDNPTLAILEGLLSGGLGQSVRKVLIGDISLDSLANSLILFSRVCSPRYAWLPKWIRRHGGRYAYFLDDNFWEYREKDLLGQYYSDPAVQHCLDEFLRNSSVVIVNSNPLKKFLEHTFGAELPVVEIPPGFDFDLVPDTPRYANACPGFVIGYSGTHRASVFDVVSDAIEIILKEYPGRVHFEFIGYCPERLLASPGVTFFPNIPDYRQFLLFNASRKWSLGLAPLADNVFTRAKTNNKFREYGALGIPGLYSDTTPYRESVDHAVNGLLCRNSAEEWAEGMRRALNSPKLLKAISENAFDTVRRLHNNKNIFPLWESTLHVAKVTPVTIGIAASTTWYLSSFVSTQRLRMSAYAAMLREGGAMALLTHVLRRAGEILRLP